jgi:hypothetical protein
VLIRASPETIREKVVERGCTFATVPKPWAVILEEVDDRALWSITIESRIG